MENEYFKRVYIKSESDLLKEECFIITKPRADSGYQLTYRWFRVEDKTWWLENIDWYLQPISQSSPLPVSEEFELSKKALKQLRLEIDHILDSGANHIRFIEMIKLFIKQQVIPEYAAQFRSETNEVTDEEINKWVQSKRSPMRSHVYVGALIEGAKWMRDQLTK